jgi:hypothetical protein
MEEKMIPLVKGSAVSPGELGLPNIVPVGNRQAFNLKNAGGSSYWWNLGPEQSKSIHKLAQATITYSNPINISSSTATETMAKGYGISIEKLRSISDEIQRTKKPGSIVFAKVSASDASLYSGGGEEFGQGIQIGKNVTPEIKMSVPEGITYSPRRSTSD